MTTIIKPVLDLEATGAKIKSLRKINNISVHTIQEIFGMENPQSIYNWERGKNMPTIDNLIVLAKILGVTVDTLIITRNVEIQIYNAPESRLLSA